MEGFFPEITYNNQVLYIVRYNRYYIKVYSVYIYIYTHSSVKWM